MKIQALQVHHLTGVDIEPPPFRDLPSAADVALLQVDTDEGITGWAVVGSPHPSLSHLLMSLESEVVGEDPLRIRKLHHKLGDTHRGKRFGRALLGAIAPLDIALWDISGKALGQPAHHLMGGVTDEVSVYVTFGAASGTVYKEKRYYPNDEMIREAEHIVGTGITRLKATVGRQDIPDPYHDLERVAALREAVGPDVTIALDAASRFTLPEARKLCRLAQDLNIDFFEEPIHYNDPALLAELRAGTDIPIAVAPNDRYSARDLLEARAVDILQPNAINDGGYTLALDIAAMARAYNKPLGHGNGTGPHNIALQAAVTDRGIVEYHYHWWKLYTAMFEEVPQPEGDRLAVSLKPGVGLEPKQGLIERYTS